MSHPATTDGVQILRDVPYGEALVGHGTSQARLRPLLLDIDLPMRPATAPRPAVLLSHGGAYHRGSKETDEFDQEGVRNTPVPAYSRHLAARGDLAASDDELRDGVEAVILDVAQACRFVQANAARWGIDAQRIAIGGFSAGASASVDAAYALGVPAAAVISLSGGFDARDAAHDLKAGTGKPPALMFSSEHDLPGIHDRTMALADRAATVGLPLRRDHVPHRPHFYDRDSPALLGSDSLGGAAAATTVGAAIDSFLDHCLHHPA